MKRNTSILFASVIIAFSALFASCSERKDTDGRLERLTDEWLAEGWDETWLQVETDQASGMITLTAQANSTGSIRETTITLACGTAEAGITVSQFYEGFKGLFVDMREFADKPVF